MTPFALHAARSPQDAVALLAAHPGAALLAGGTTLPALMKLDVAKPSDVIDISRIGHDGIKRMGGGQGDGWRIGALARNGDVARHPGIAAELPVLAQAILQGASGQLRNMATTGGNLLQRSHCPCFRDIHSACNKRVPGSGCDAIGGQNRGQAVLGTSAHCIAAHPGDMAVALAALGARVNLLGPHSERTVDFTSFNVEPGTTPDRETVMRPGEIILSMDVPAPPFARCSLYRKMRERASYEYALVSCALALDLDEAGAIREARIALGGVATRPWRAWDAEAALRGRRPSAAAFGEAARLAMRGAVPQSRNAFKVGLARQVLAQTLAELTEVPA